MVIRSMNQVSAGGGWVILEVVDLSTLPIDPAQRGALHEQFPRYCNLDYGVNWSRKTLKQRLQSLGLGHRPGKPIQNEPWGCVGLTQSLFNQPNDNRIRD
jgi:hypothetical protein